MTIQKTDDFSNDFNKLPVDAKRLFRKQESIFLKDWLDSRLHTKKIKELENVYSFRITRRYRALFYFRDTEAIFFAVGHRKDIYRK